MNSNSPDLIPWTTFAAKGAAQLPATDNLFVSLMQSLWVLAVAIATPVSSHPGLYAGGYLFGLIGATYTLWRTRLAEQAQNR